LANVVETIRLELLRNKIKETIPIQSRLKNLDSIFEKLELGKIRIKRIEDIQDIIGIRIILLFNSDIQKVEKILDDNFQIKRMRDTSKKLKDNEFGYKSLYLIAEIDKKNYEGYPFKKMTCEIQV